jgi:ribosomal silencing factor RsfS
MAPRAQRKALHQKKATRIGKKSKRAPYQRRGKEVKEWVIMKHHPIMDK